MQENSIKTVYRICIYLNFSTVQYDKRKVTLDIHFKNFPAKQILSSGLQVRLPQTSVSKTSEMFNRVYPGYIRTSTHRGDCHYTGEEGGGVGYEERRGL